MKNYSIKERNEIQVKTYVTDFEIIDEKDIIVHTADGRDVVIPYTKRNLMTLRNIMTEQAKQAQGLLKSKRRKRAGYTVLTIAGVAGIVLANTTDFGKEINPIIANGSLTGVTLLSGCGVIRNARFVTDIRKLGIFVKHSKKLNAAIASNPYMYANISDKDKARIDFWLEQYGSEPLVIENMDQISYDSVKKILDNIRLSQELGLDYSQEEPGFQKIKEQI